MFSGRRAAVRAAILGGDPQRDRSIWAFYCRHFDIPTIMDLAYECASMFRQGEIKWPVRSFQRKLMKHFPKTSA